MPKLLPKRRLGRTPVSKCWYLADTLVDIAQLVRYSDKPADLSYPISEMAGALRRTQLLRDQWFQSKFKDRKEDPETFPKLWERYL